MKGDDWITPVFLCSRRSEGLSIMRERSISEKGVNMVKECMYEPNDKTERYHICSDNNIIAKHDDDGGMDQTKRRRRRKRPARNMICHQAKPVAVAVNAEAARRGRLQSLR